MAKRKGKASIAIICLESKPALSCAVIAAGIPTADKPDADLFKVIKTGDYVKVDATRGLTNVKNE